jgi:hypothetical protein
MEKMQKGPTWWNLSKIETDTATGITYKWFNSDYSAADTDTTGTLEKITSATDGTTTTYVTLKRKGSWTARATGWPE